MSLRDLLVLSILFAAAVLAIKRPFIGALAWVLFGVMNPHRLTYGIAYNFPSAQLIAAVTLLGILVTKEHRQVKGGGVATCLCVFFAWQCLTTLTALEFDEALDYQIRVFKIYLMTLVLLVLMNTREHVLALVAMLVFSLGFYGVKGGLFVIATGGNYMVNGPPDSVMEGNNSLGVGLVMIIPLMYFLSQQVTKRWQRWLLFASMGVCMVAVLGAYSRGAMLALAAMGIFLWLRSKNKLVLLALAVVIIAVAIPAMPAQWVAKMDTLGGYKDDASAMFRIYTWETAYNIAKDRFPLAGGFEWQSLRTSAKYSPLPTLVLVPHSIYFQVIGSQGFIGLAIFLTFWGAVWRQCVFLRQQARTNATLLWAGQLGTMVQVSIVGYAVGAAFLDLAFWDVPYYLVAAVGAAVYFVKEKTKSALRAPWQQSPQLG